jgi:hypothetical protein
MLRSLLFAASCIVVSAVAADSERPPERAPVLVELFTSEGCSSCPPADRHLQQLDSQVIVLSEHVDYWDHLGWKDRFSSPAFTERQEAYARQFGLDSPYTPQMVVDGVAQFTGGDTRRAAAEIDKAADRPKAAIYLSRSGAGVRVDIESAPKEADLWLALADNSDLTRVAGGENKGHTLTHVAVVRSMRKLGSLKRGGAFSRHVDLPAGAAGQRVVVFLQEAGQARVLGAAMLPAPEI